MGEPGLWKYCTAGHCREMILSLRLLEGEEWTQGRVLSCLYAISNHTEKHYNKQKLIKKGGGVRHILAPDPVLKTIQRNILHHVLEGLEVSPCAMAYRKGASVRLNAACHMDKQVVLKLDIKDFFGSITFPMVHRGAFNSRYFPVPVGTLLTSLCCCQDRLPQGSPASAAISNLVMKPFDTYMEGWCRDRGIVYTRYCDDMTFSGDFRVSAVYGKVNGFLGAMGFELNQSKTKVLTRHVRQTVTGMVVNDKVQVPLPYRRALRQEVYYCLKYGVKEHLRHRGETAYLAMGEEGELRYLQSLCGRIGFVLSADPEDKWFREAADLVTGNIKTYLK